MKSKNKLLVISSKYDLHADYIINKCNAIGKQDDVIRLNTEDFASNCKVVFNGNDFEIKILDSGRTFTDSEILSVWFRRPKKVMVDKINDEGVADFITNQSEAFLNGLYHSLLDTAKWINPIDTLQKGQHKITQLKLAKSIGFNVPKVLITNSVETAEFFFSQTAQVCNKSLNRPNYYLDGEFRTFYTKKVDINDFKEHHKSIELCPTFFEEYIEKAFDIRVVVIESEVFAFKIDSQSNLDSQIDFRGADATKIIHTPYTLPSDIIEKVLKFVEASGLIYSSMDLVLSTDNEYYFIENNSNGQWLWLEYLTGVNISDSLIKCFFKSN